MTVASADVFPGRRGRRFRDPVIALALVVLTLSLYGAAVRFGFCDYDDPDYVTDNAVVRQALAALTSAAVVARRRPAILMGWLWFVGTLVPVIGLVKVGIVLAGQGRIEESIASFTATLRLEPGNAAARLNLERAVAMRRGRR